MKSVKPMISVEEARRLVLEHTSRLGSEIVQVTEALGRILAEDVRSDMNMPPFDKSAMDGYAVRASDVSEASSDSPVCLRVTEDIPAGVIPTLVLFAGTAARIMTGAPLPPEADAVVMVEVTGRVGDDHVNIFAPVRRGQNVCVLGEDVKVGQIVLRQGQWIRPQEAGMLASVGKTEVRVILQPEVAILPTGSEIVEPGHPLSAGQIRNSNGYSLYAQALAAGARVHYLGIADDTKPELKTKVLDGLASDVLLLSGGVSMGDYDLVTETLLDLGVEIFFESVRIKPGKPTVFGRKDETLVFGLPGNPVSTMVIFEAFIYPVLRKMQGYTAWERPMVKATLERSFSKRPGRRQYAPSWTRWAGEGWKVAPVSSHGSADLMSMIQGNSLMIVPEEFGELEPGTSVDVQLLDESVFPR